MVSVGQASVGLAPLMKSPFQSCGSECGSTVVDAHAAHRSAIRTGDNCEDMLCFNQTLRAAALDHKQPFTILALDRLLTATTSR